MDRRDSVNNSKDAAHRRAVLVDNGHAWLAQRYAIDWVQYRTVDGVRTTWKGPEDKDDSYFCYDQPIYSVAAGKVVDMADGLPDNVPHSGKYAVSIDFNNAAGNQPRPGSPISSTAPRRLRNTSNVPSLGGMRWRPNAASLTCRPISKATVHKTRATPITRRGQETALPIGMSVAWSSGQSDSRSPSFAGFRRAPRSPGTIASKGGAVSGNGKASPWQTF